MAHVSKFYVRTLSMVSKEKLQRVEIDYFCSRSAFFSLDVYKKGKQIISGYRVALDNGKGTAVLMLPVQEDSFMAVWKLTDREGNPAAETTALWSRPRELTLFVMISSHTDIGLHNSPYIQRYNSSQFLDKAMELCDKTEVREDNDKYRYTIEGTWFWNNYGLDRGRENADKIVSEYIKKNKIGICSGMAGNHIQVYGLEEMCRSTYERKRLKEEWGIESETMAMIDNNGLPMSLIQPYVEAGYKNIIFAPNQWNPLPSTIWNMDRLKCEDGGYLWSPDANGGGARIDIRYDSSLPMVFYWEDNNRNRILVWGSVQYNHGGAPFGLLPCKKFNSETVPFMEACMARNLPVFEENYPYDIWLVACYWDDQEPDINLIDSISAWNNKWEWPQIRALGNPDIPFRLLREKYEKKIPVLKGDITGGWYQHPVAAAELLAQKFEADRLLPTAEQWSVVAALIDPEYEYPAEDFKRAWNYLLYNDEHSYGTSGYQGQRVYETWMQHRDWINKALETAERENDRALKTIAGKIDAVEDRIVVFNRTNMKRQEMLLSADGDKYALIDVPAFGFRTVKMDEFTACSRIIEKTEQPPIVENKYYKVTFAPNGSIRSIIDREMGLELADLNNRYHINEPIYTKDDHKTFHVPEKAAFKIEREKERIKVVARTKEENLGAEIIQTVILPEYEKCIDIDDHIYHAKDMINDQRYNRYLYYAFPFEIGKCRRYCHLNGVVAEYAVDVTGHGTDVYMAANEWCCSENQEYGVALMMKDSQLIEFDRIHPDKTSFGDTGEGAQIFSYVANDWLQMHSPGGSHLNYRFRYSITSYRGDYRSSYIPQKAEKYVNPVQTVSISAQKGPIKEEFRSFFTIPETLRILCLKRAEDGKGIIARLYGRSSEGENKAFIDSFGREMAVERVGIDEGSLYDKNVITTGFLTYRLGKETIKIKEKAKEASINDNEGPEAIGSVYTGLITRPCAAAGENLGQLYLLWGQNMEKGLSHYKLYRSERPDFEADRDSFVTDVMPGKYRVVSYSDTGLKNHTRYYYKVCAVDKNGRYGKMSDVFEGITREKNPC